jgi:hypothetical protein
MTLSSLLAGLLAATVIAAVSAATGNAIFSPGQLSGETESSDSPAEAAIGSLGPGEGTAASHADLDMECGACHPAFWSGERMGDRCLDCHTDVQEQIGLESGFHAGYATSANCRDCHTDHRGREASLTRVDLRGFPHERTGYLLWAHPLTVDGGPFVCLDCHPDSLQVFDLGACRDCHVEDNLAFTIQHQASFGTGCIACHDGVDTYGRDWDHGSTEFPLEGRHAEAECLLCHRQATNLADLSAAPSDCIACHRTDDLHEGRLGLDCGECHGPDGWEGASLDHDRTRFSLTGSHVEVDCGRCHVDRQWTGIGTACRTCHSADDKHDGQFAVDCADCHTAVAWSDVTFTHARTGFPLEASHAEVNCAGCHPGGQYVGTPSSCFGCHAGEDDHNGRFGRDCGACHRPTRWSDATFDHELASFRLTGAHARVACESCHRGGSFSGTPSSCSACHSRPSSHGSAFSGDCGSCHSTSAWRPASFNGPHPFPMNHGGAGGNCATCHPSSLTSSSCTVCHEHNEAKMQDEHKEISGFSMGACLNCHPGGREGDDD